MTPLNIRAAIEASYRHGEEFPTFRAAIDAVVASTRDKDMVVEALTRDLLATAIRLEVQSLRKHCHPVRGNAVRCRADQTGLPARRLNCDAKGGNA